MGSAEAGLRPARAPPCFGSAKTSAVGLAPVGFGGFPPPNLSDRLYAAARCGALPCRRRARPPKPAALPAAPPHNTPRLKKARATRAASPPLLFRQRVFCYAPLRPLGSRPKQPHSAAFRSLRRLRRRPSGLRRPGAAPRGRGQGSLPLTLSPAPPQAAACRFGAPRAGAALGAASSALFKRRARPRAQGTRGARPPTVPLPSPLLAQEGGRPRRYRRECCSR